MSDYEFSFVVENMTREQANALGDLIVLFAELNNLLCGGNVHGNEIKEVEDDNPKG